SRARRSHGARGDGGSFGQQVDLIALKLSRARQRARTPLPREVPRDAHQTSPKSRSRASRVHTLLPVHAAAAVCSSSRPSRAVPSTATFESDEGRRIAVAETVCPQCKGYGQTDIYMAGSARELVWGAMGLVRLVVRAVCDSATDSDDSRN